LYSPLYNTSAFQNFSSIYVHICISVASKEKLMYCWNIKA